MSEGAQVDELYRDGQQAWPLIAVELETFRKHFARVASSPSENESPRDGAGLYLCCACAAGDGAALQAFEDHCRDTALLAISRIESDREIVQEVLQILRDKLLVGPPPKVLDYSGRGALQAWVRIAALRLALDHCRARKALSQRQRELNDRFMSADPDPELLLLRERYLPQFRESLRRAVAGLSRQDRNVLRMHVVGQCTIDDIGRAYSVHRATAARWLERARARIYGTVRDELAHQHRLTDSEFKSLARGLGSELSLDLSHGSSVSTLLTSRPLG